jgi:hypothetical protein
MKSILVLALAAALSGCAYGPNAFINKYVPNGQLASVSVLVGATGGSGGSLMAKNVVKTSTSITAGEIHVQIHNMATPVFQLDAVANPGTTVTVPTQ